jgi:hypothetical protein
MTNESRASLFELLHGHDLPEAELRCLISFHFKHGVISQPGQVDYRHEQAGRVALTMQYDRRGALSDILRGPALDDGDLADLARAIQGELASSGIAVARTFLFASVPTATWWRYQSLVQIVPVPTNAPQPGQLVGEHPFVLEVSHRLACDMQLRMVRARETLREWELLLCLVLGFGIHGLERYSTKHWVLVPESIEPLALHSSFLQSGYFVDGYAPPRDEFTAPDGIEPMEIVADPDFFNRIGISAGETLRAPHLMQTAADRFVSMSVLAKEQFLRACYWLQLSERQWALSNSASYASLVQAVECLVPPAAAAVCPECNRPLEGATRGFDNFVETYAMGVPKSDRRAFYQLRSSILHGDRLLEADDDSSLVGLRPLDWEQHDTHRSMSRTARLAVVNFLLSAPPALPKSEIRERTG